MAAIELVGLTKRYAPGAKPAVDGINLRIASGSYCCLLGPSGCGKSTTLRMVAGHESVTEGDILLENRNITDLPDGAAWYQAKIKDRTTLALTPDELTRVRTALREFGAAWRPLNPGQSLERTF